MKTALAFPLIGCCGMLALPGGAGDSAPSSEVQTQLTQLLDAPLLFVKSHSYTNIHIYDTYYNWPPGGGGIYILENPSAPRSDLRSSSRESARRAPRSAARL